MMPRESPERSFDWTDPSTPVAELSLGPDTHNTCVANLGARWFRLADSVTTVVYRVLSERIRRLNAEIHTAASVYGYFVFASSVAPLKDPPGKQSIGRKRGPREEATTEPDAHDKRSGVKPRVETQASQSVDPWGNLRRRLSWLLCFSFTGLKHATRISATAAVWAVIVLLSRKSSAQLVVDGMGIFIFILVASCAVVWGHLEFTVRRSSKRIYQLLADFDLQHKLSGEIVRWIQELEATLKAFPDIRGKRDQSVAGASPSGSPCTDSHGQACDCFSEQRYEVSVIGPPHWGNIPCQNGRVSGPEWGQLPPDGLQMEPCAWHLRMRLYQVLDWQQRIFCYLYEDIIRGEPRTRPAWKCRMSQGPWRHAEQSCSGSCQFDGSLRVLKEMTSRSWILHSRLLGGIQVALRHILFSLSTQLLRSDFALTRKYGSDARAFSSIPKGMLTHHSSRFLKQALLKAQQHYSANGCSRSLREEIDMAAGVRGQGERDTQILKGFLLNRCGSSCTSCSTTSGKRQKRVQQSTTSTTTVAEKGASGHQEQFAWVWIMRNALVVGLFSVCTVFEAVVDGIRALWWLFSRIHRLGVALSAAGQVAAETANALRLILEEDWASSPFSSQPRWGGRMGKGGEVPDKRTDVVGKSLQVTHCSVFPPTSSSQYSATLLKNAPEKHRSALASMSRNVGASLALLRLPAADYSCHFKRQGGDLSVQGEHRTACDSDRCSVDSGSSVLLPQTNQLTVPEERQEAADAEVLRLLHLILRHLRVAFEEGEKLEKALWSRGEQFAGIRTSDTARASEVAPVQPLERTTATDETEQQLQPTVAESVQCLEVYTAVGQDSVTSRLRYKEEERLKEAFAEDDPAVRERSQITLRELELSLKRKEKERQCFPRVLKELSVIDSGHADGSDYGEAEERAIVRVVTESSREVGHFSAAKSSPRVPTFTLGEQDVQEKATSLSNKIGTGGDANAKNVAYQGFSDFSPLHGENTVLEAVSEPEETRSLRDVETLDNEQVAFRMRQEKLKGCCAGSVSLSPEALATQSLMSQLSGVLQRQKRPSSEGHNLLSSRAALLGTPLASSNSGTFGDSLADEEWSACDVVEGPSCAAEVPTWVAAPSDLGDSGVDSLNVQRESCV